MDEIWKDIPGYENLYQISNMGRVKSMEQNINGRNCSIRTIRERILKPKKDTLGYLQIGLCKKMKRKFMLVHRLVCEAFLTNPYNLPEVNHKNECKTDNRLENLEYCDHIYNSNFGTRNERVAKARSKPVKCLETGKIYPSAREIQRQLGFARQSICACCNGRQKTCGKLHWEYVD